MPISVTCRCGKRLRVNDELVGKRVKCPDCGVVLPTPNSAAAPEQPVSAANHDAAEPSKSRQKRSRKVMLFVGVGAAVLLCGFGLWYFMLKSLPREGPGDPALTYDVVAKNAAKYRGKRVTWSFVFCQGTGKRVLGCVNWNDALRTGHGFYMVEFASDDEMLRASANQGGPQDNPTTLTGTIAGEVDEFLTIRGPNIVQKEPSKTTVPLLLFPIFRGGDTDKGKN